MTACHCDAIKVADCHCFDDIPCVECDRLRARVSELESALVLKTYLLEKQMAETTLWLADMRKAADAMLAQREPQP